MNSKQALKYALGLDIGIASVGWALLGEHRIIDLGVRCFDKAETADKGESLNLARRSARLLRRRLRRRAWRLTKLSRLLKREGLIADVNMLKQPPAKGFSTPNLWQLRVDALNRRLSPEEWSRVIYHICKHRGFHWLSKAEEKKADDDKEGGAVKKGLAGTKRLMQDKGYRSTAEMVVNEFPDAQRNKRGDYSKALSRELLSNELQLLFERQRVLGNPNTSSDLENKLLERKHGLLWAQKPSLSGEALLKMLGKCTFEENEYRAPKASFTVERHVWLTRLNNCRLIIDGEKRELSPAERAIAIQLPYDQSSDFTYKQLRKALAKAGLTNEFRFAGLVYPSALQSEQEKAKDPEEEKLIKLPAWQQLRKAMKDAGLESDWQKIAIDALEGKAHLYDEIARVLSIYKEDEEVERELNKLDLPNKSKMVDVLQTIRFEQFSNLSLKALYKILPHMEQGERYDAACLTAGYHHSQLHKIGTGEHKYLPAFYIGRDKDGRLKFNEDLDIPRNPVVLRALNQARKVINAIIKKYGSPDQVHIEMARDLSKSFDDRRDIKKAQDEYRDRNEKDRTTFNLEFNTTGELKGREFEKWQLYREQHGKCAYSLQPLDIHRLFEMGYAEVDHALPYSRSYDDSKNNRVLVLAAENRNKGNMTPYEYLGGAQNSLRWLEYVAFVNSNKTYRQAKRNRLLRKDFGEEAAKEFSERNLNDTRYICRFFKNYVERYLKLADDSDSKRCVVVNGQLTSFLRARWGLIKVRSDSDRHHALDAAIVAACSHSMVKRLADYSRRKEVEAAREGFVDITTGDVANHAMYTQLEQHFPAPWPHFRQELQARLFVDDLEALCNELANIGYETEALENVKPLFVSRATQRRNQGALHEATLRSPKLIESGESHTRVDIRKLKLAHLDRIVGADDPRNKGLIDALRARLEAHNDDGKKAFSTLLFKPANDGRRAPVVRTVKVKTTQKTGALIGSAIADLGDMLRVDVFKNNSRYFLIPVYGVTSNRRINPITAPENAIFLFSLTKNDFLEVTIGSETTRGYFVMFESDGRLTLRAHDQPQPDKNYFRKSVSSATKLSKFNIDVLGNIYSAKSEIRSDLA